MKDKRKISVRYFLNVIFWLCNNSIIYDDQFHRVVVAIILGTLFGMHSVCVRMGGLEIELRLQKRLLINNQYM